MRFIKLMLFLCLIEGCVSGPNPYQVVDPRDPWHTRSYPLYEYRQTPMNQNPSVNVNVYNYIASPNEKGDLKRTYYRKEVINVPSNR